MKADLQPTLNPLSQIFLQLPSKQISLPPTQTSLAKLPQGAKTIGNYLLGAFLMIQGRTLVRALSGRSTLLSTCPQVKKWQ